MSPPLSPSKSILSSTGNRFLGGNSSILNHSTHLLQPLAQAQFYYDRAKNLYLNGTGKSSELERVIRDISRACIHTPNDPKHYIFFAKVFKRLHDFHSMMTSLSFVLKLDSAHPLGRRMLYDGYFHRGQEYMCLAAEENNIDYENSQRLWKKALACYDAAITINHNEVRVWLHHAICCIHMKENVKALASINHCIRISNNNPEDNTDVMTLRAKLYWALGLIDVGNKEIREVAKYAPDHIEVLAYTARCYHAAENYYKFSIREFALKNYKDALHYATVAVKVTDDDIKLYILLSKIHRVMGNLEEAFRYIRKAQEVYTIQSLQKTSHYQRQQEKDSKTSTTNGLALLAPTLNNNSSMSSSVNDNGNSNSAISSSSPSISDDIVDSSIEKIKYQMEVPDEIIRQTNLIYNELAVQYASKGDYQRAIVLFTKVIHSSNDLCERYKVYVRRKAVSHLSPFHSSTNNMSNVNSTKEDQQDETYYKYLMDYRYYVNRADCYRAIDKYENAYTDYQVALSISPTDWSIKTKMSMIHYIQGVKHFNNSNFLPAEFELSKAIEHNPKISEYYATRGRIRYYCANYSGAALDYKKCLELDPKASDIAMKLEQFDTGGTHSMKRMTQSLPSNIIKLIETSNHQIKKLKSDMMREKIEKQGLFYHEDDEDDEEGDQNGNGNRNDVPTDDVKSYIRHQIYRISKSKSKSKRQYQKAKLDSRFNSILDSESNSRLSQSLPKLPVLKVSSSSSSPPSSSSLSIKDSSNQRFISSSMALRKNSISSTFIPVIKQSEEYKIRKENVKREFNKKLDTSKSSLWPLLNSAKTLAHEMREKVEETKEHVASSSSSSLLLPSSISSATLKHMSKLVSEKGYSSNNNKILAKGISSNSKAPSFMKKFHDFGKFQPNKFRHIRRSSSLCSRVSSRSDIESVDSEDQLFSPTGGFGTMLLNEMTDTMSISLGDYNFAAKNVIPEEDGDYNDDEDDEYHEDDEEDILSPRSIMSDSSIQSGNGNTKRKSRKRRSIKNRNSTEDIEDDDLNEREQLNIELLMKPIGESKLVKFLSSTGLDTNWKIPGDGSANSHNDTENNQESGLLGTEDEELKKAYQKEQLEIENQLISKRVASMKVEMEIREKQMAEKQRMELLRQSSYASSVDSFY